MDTVNTLKRRSSSTRLHGATSQKTDTFDVKFVKKGTWKNTNSSLLKFGGTCVHADISFTFRHV